MSFSAQVAEILTARFDRLESRIDQLEADRDVLWQRLETVDGRLAELNRKVQPLTDLAEAIQAAAAQLEVPR